MNLKDVVSFNSVTKLQMKLKYTDNNQKKKIKHAERRVIGSLLTLNIKLKGSYFMAKDDQLVIRLGNKTEDDMKQPITKLFEMHTKSNVRITSTMGVDYANRDDRGIRINSNYILIDKLIKGKDSILLFSDNNGYNHSFDKDYFKEDDADEIIMWGVND